MTVREAEGIVRAFDENKNPSEDEVFMFIEALNFLIEELHRPQDMMYLGGYYYEIKKFELALKYYDMAATYDYDPAYECLGYIWYYGRTGQKDYKKAFENFSKMMNKGNLVATYKVADMYKNGYYVEKSMDTYRQMIEDLYPKVKNLRSVFDPVPEVYTRLASIRKEQGRLEDAANLYLYAKKFLAQRIRINAFFGNISIMKWLIDDLYDICEFDEEDFDFYDMFYLLKTPHRITFLYEDREMLVETELEGDACNVCFNGKWFRSREDFYKNAVVDGVMATALYDDFYGFEVIE